MPKFALDPNLPMEGLVAATAVVLIAVCLTECFFGYLLYRLSLVVNGIGVGAYLGAYIVSHLIQRPTGLDYFVCCTALAILAAMLSWFLHRLMLSASILVLAWFVITFEASLGAEAWVSVLVGFAGLIVAALSFIYLRPIFIVLTSAAGALGAVILGAALILGQDTIQRAASRDRSWILLGVLAGISITIAVLGTYAQFKISGIIRSRLFPPPPKRSSTRSIKPRIGRR